MNLFLIAGDSSCTDDNYTGNTIFVEKYIYNIYMYI